MTKKVIIDGIEYVPLVAKKAKTYELEAENLKVESKYVDNVTVWENDGNQYFTWDAAIIHCARLGKRMPTKEEWEVICKKNTLEELNEILPLAGYRHCSSAAYGSQGADGYYWASSPTGTNGYYVTLSATQVLPADNDNRAYGFSVRCLKN